MKNNTEKLVTKSHIRNRTIFSFSVLALFSVFIFFGWRWLHNQPDDNGTPKPVRNVLNFDESVFGNFLSNDHLAKTFPVSAAVKNVRVNGSEGMSDDFDPASWKLKVARKPGDTLLITLDEIKKLPKTEIIFDFKCIEGWSQVTHWGGVKFSDFAKKYGLDDQTAMKYMGLITPDAGYYVGIDMPSVMHPQTLLCYEMNGKPLPMNQGAPLRLIIPVKYGIKHLKRIGTMFFSNERPPDYWYERGYDYFSGL
ncbi:MAG: molybdopterin-dependent oxidoreductase [Chitinophagaceae bacterium]|nr:molybdopterin-dependent oxidoreductase [Chitinophagaceae bacterium]